MSDQRRLRLFHRWLVLGYVCALLAISISVGAAIGYYRYHSQHAALEISRSR